MSQTKISIGHVPVNRGAWSSNTRYYKDNIVQYLGGSYIASPPGYSVDNPDAYITSKPYESVPSQLNTGWSVFADGEQNNSVHINDAQQLTDAQKAQALANVGISGIDDEPVSGSENLVKSGGVEKYLATHDIDTTPVVSEVGAMKPDGTIDSTAEGYLTKKASLQPGECLELNNGEPFYLGVNVASVFLTDSSGNLQSVLHSRDVDGVNYVTIQYTNNSDSIVYLGWSGQKAQANRYRIYYCVKAAAEEKLQEVENTVNGKANDNEVVKVVQQSLTDVQKEQALENIGIEIETKPTKDSSKIITSGGVEKYLARHVSDFTTGGGVNNTAMRITNGVVSPNSDAGYRSYGLDNIPKSCHLKAGDTVTTPSMYAPTWLSVISKIITDGSNTTYECLLQGKGGTQDYAYTAIEDIDVVFSTNGSKAIHIEGLEEAAPKSVEEDISNLSSNISSTNTRVTTLESNVTTLDTRVTTLEGKSKVSNLGTLEYKKIYHHLNVEANNSIIPSQSLFDIAYAKALGAKVIEANIQRCSDGVYVTKHGGASGNLGNGLLFASGSSINSDTLFSEVTSTQLRADVTYDSPVAKYRGFIPTVTEFCKECARLDMIPYLRGCNVEVLAEARKYLSDDHLIIEGPATRGDFKGLMMIWSNEQTPSSILNICNAKGTPFMFGWLSLPEDDTLTAEVAQMLHQNGYMFGACYLNQTKYQQALTKGFDTFGSTYRHINPFEVGNKLNIFNGADNNLQLTNVTYDSSADVLNMNQGGTIVVESSEIGSSLSKICVKLRYSGNINVEVASSADNLQEYLSDGTSEIVIAVALQKVGNRILRITANTSTTVYDLKVFASIL